MQNELELERKLFSGGSVVVVEWEPSENWSIKYISKNSRFVLGFSREEMMTNIYEQSYRLRFKE